MEIKFTEKAWAQYLEFDQDKKARKRIHALIKDISRGKPTEGLGKPEPLKGDLAGYWSRRIDEKNRLVYCIENGVCEISLCKGHYEKD